MWRLQHRNRIIDSRNSPRSKRIEAYAGRGQEWYVKHDCDKAITDFDHAIDLNLKGLAQYRTGAILADGNRGNAYSEGDAKRTIENYTMAIRDRSEVHGLLHLSWPAISRARVTIPPEIVDRLKTLACIRQMKWTLRLGKVA